MDTITGNTVASRPFMFTVGPKQREFMLHAALVAAQSKPLYALVNGPMKEAKESHVVWDDISEETFVRFCQYAYTGDYTSIEPRRESHNGHDRGRIRSIPRRAKKEQFWKQFTNASLEEALLPESSHANRPNLQPRKNADEFADFTDVFLSHARLYVFADRYQISELKLLSLSKLANQLGVFELHDKRKADVLALLKFCFADDPVPAQLERLVCLYAAYHLKALWETSGFQEFYVSHTEFSKTVTGFLVQRLEKLERLEDKWENY